VLPHCLALLSFSVTLDYCNALLCGISVGLVQRLQNGQLGWTLELVDESARRCWGSFTGCLWGNESTLKSCCWCTSRATASPRRTYFTQRSTCWYPVSAHAASARRICSSVRQFLIC